MGLPTTRDLRAWDSRIAVLADYPLFRDMKRGLSLREKIGTTVSDLLDIMSMVHLRFGSA